MIWDDYSVQTRISIQTGDSARGENICLCVVGKLLLDADYLEEKRKEDN